jgi:hypothetical protein
MKRLAMLCLFGSHMRPSSRNLQFFEVMKLQTGDISLSSRRSSPADPILWQ